MELLIISGTNRPRNLSIVLARAYQAKLQHLGLDAGLLSLEDLPEDILRTDLYGKRSADFQAWQDAIGSVRHLLFVVPEYNGSIPGILKIFIDALDYPHTFRGKYAWLLGLGAGAGGNEKGLQHLADILQFLGSEVSHINPTLPKIREKLLRTGEITHEGTLSLLDEQAKNIIEMVKGPRLQPL